MKYAKAIAANTDLETSQAFLFHQDTLYVSALLSVTGDDVFVKVRQLASELEEEFFESTDPLATRLEQALENLSSKLKDVEHKQILLACWEEKEPGVLYLKSLGAQKAYLLRKGSLITLISAEKSGQLISGFLQEGDKLLLVSESMDSYIGDEAKVVDLISVPVDQLEEEINSQVLEHQRGEPVAAILVDFQKEVEVEQAAPAQPEQGFVPIPHFDDQESVQKKLKLHISLPHIRDFDLDKMKYTIKSNVPKTQKGKLYLGLGLLAILLIGIAFTTHSKSQKEKNVQVATYLSSARSELQGAESLKDLDTSQATTSLASAKKDVESALKIDPKNSDALALQNQINTESGDILKLYEINSWPLFLDLSLIKSNFSTTRMSLSLGKILLLDKNQKSLVQIDLQTKNNQILAGGGQIGIPQEASLNGGTAFVYSSDKGVTSIDAQSLKVTNVIKPDSDWGEIGDIMGFGGNVYLLDKTKNQIWKYVPVASGYSDKTNYIKSGVSADFGGSIKFLIDSSVWVLDQNKGLERFTAGSSDFYSVGGLDKPITNLTNFFVSDETNNMYLLDSGNSRLIVTSKTGQYVSQYVGDKFKTASDFVVDEKGKKIYLLDSNKIYTVDLH